jgi:hypothetical protein
MSLVVPDTLTTQGLTVSAWLLFVNGPTWHEEGTYVPVKSCAHETRRSYWNCRAPWLAEYHQFRPASQGILQRRRELQSIGYGKEIGS